MKFAFLVLLLIAAAPIEGSAGESAQLEVKTSGQAVSLDSAKDLAVKFWLQQLVLSALYRDVVQDSTVSEWANALKAESIIHCRYPANSLLAIPERQALTFDEILVPVPAGDSPAYVYLKRGSTYARVAKFDPWVLGKLKVEAGISTRLAPVIARGLF
jgi:hypothetical protein